MHIITQTRLREFAEVHSDAAPSLRAWETLVKSRRYRTPHDVRADFGNADFLGGGKVVFNIAGNKYRLVTVMLYRANKVLIRHVLTHHDYDRMTLSGNL